MGKPIATLLTTTLATYAICSFISMNLNPDDWNIWLRVAFCVFFFSSVINYKLEKNSI